MISTPAQLYRAIDYPVRAIPRLPKNGIGVVMAATRL
jgi:hypothetical protein